jgi:GTP-binding protein
MIMTSFGSPDGGSGGKGGDIYAKGSRNMTSLNHIKPRYRSTEGGKGGTRMKNGAKGADIVIEVPLGTLIKQVELREHEREQEEEEVILPVPGDTPELAQIRQYVESHYHLRTKERLQMDRLLFLGERIPKKRMPFQLTSMIEVNDTETLHILARGGRGGQGNAAFFGNDLRGPSFALKGEKGDRVAYEFELKTLADAGMVGLPNAGKSTFLAAVSNAHPKIGNYAFTTLNPYVGTIEYPDFWTLTLADVPGIIKDASKNKGLGHLFLRHIERSRVLVYVIDMSGPAPWEDLQILMDELEAYKVGMTQRPSMVVANKADQEKARENLQEFVKRTSFPVVPVSAMEQKNIQTATALLRNLVEKHSSV